MSETLTPTATVVESPPTRSHQQVAGAGDRLHGPVHGRARRDRREHRAALGAARPALLAGQPPVGGQRLHARLRRLPAARRPRRRPPRPQAAVRGRRAAVLGRLAAQRLRPVLRDADRRPRPAGPRRRARLPRRPGDHHHHLHRRQRAHQGAGRLERDRGLGRGRRPADGRRPHRPRLVALGVLRQRARRHRHDRPGVALRRRVAGRGRAPLVRPRRRGDRHRRSRRARLRDRQGAVLRLGLGQDHRTAGAARWRCWARSSSSSPAARRR